MSKLGNIPIRVEQTPTQEDFAVALSVLHEIHTLLERLLAEGEVGAIDLRAVPNLNPASLGLLEQWLSLGEVSAVVTSVFLALKPQPGRNRRRRSLSTESRNSIHPNVIGGKVVKRPVLLQEGQLWTQSALGKFGFLHADDVCLQGVQQFFEGLSAACEEVQQAVHVPCHDVHFIANRCNGASVL